MNNLAEWTLKEVLLWSAALRRVSETAPTAEAAAATFVRSLTELLVDPQTGHEGWTLAGCFRTIVHQHLPQASQAAMRQHFAEVALAATTPCLVPLAIAPTLTDWVPIPLVNPSLQASKTIMVELFQQMGLTVHHCPSEQVCVLHAKPTDAVDAASINLTESGCIFYLPEAITATSPSLPIPNGTQTLVGWEGQLPGGDRLLLWLCLKRPISLTLAAQFHAIGLTLRLLLLPYETQQDTQGDRKLAQLQQKVADLEALLSTHERSLQMNQAAAIANPGNSDVISSPESLRESQERFRRIFNQAAVGIVLGALSGQYLLVNQKYAEILQYSPAELLTKTFQEVTYPEDLGSDLHHVKQLLSGSIQNFSIEKRYIRKNGQLIWVKLTASLVRDAQNNPAYFVGVVEDINDRKQAEEQLQQNEARLSEALQTARLAYWEYDLTQHCFILNDQFYAIFHTTAAAQGGTQMRLADYIQRFVHPDDAPVVTAQLRMAMTMNTPHYSRQIEHRVLFENDQEGCVTVRIRLALNAQGEIFKAYGTVQDISDRKRAENEIRKLNEDLESLVEQRTAELLTFINALPDQIFVVDRKEMSIPFCNDVLARAIGVQHRYEIEGKSIYECFPAEDAAYLAEQNSQVFATGATLRLQETRHLPSGTFYMDTFKIPLKHADGEVYALIGTSRDVTELVLARQALSQRTEQLEAANRELESFSYSVSHDLRAPLRHVSGFVNALAERLEATNATDDPKVLHYLDVIRGSSHKMGQLIDGLLTLSRVGRRQLVLRPVQLNTLVEAAIAITQPTLNTDAVPAVAFILHPLPTVEGDATLLQQVFTNLIDNAIKFSRQANPARIEIGALPDGTVFVRDNGVGFSMEYADQLFGAFQRLHSSHEFEGTGIGLAIVQRILHRHSGTIWADSQPGHGACFYFRLRLCTEPAQD